MLWVKALHIIFVISWMAGLLYLPRLFVNHAMVDRRGHQAAARADGSQTAALHDHSGQARRRFSASGTGSVAGQWQFIGGGWLHAKLTLVIGLGIFHGYCAKVVRDFAAGRNTRSHAWFRYFNEIPTVLMIAIVILVVVKPF